MSEFRKDVALKRVAQGSYNNKGLWVDGAETDMTIKASVQPATTEDLQSLPENRRTLGAYRLYSSFEFQTLVEGQKNPDVVTIKGQEYEIAQVDPWENGVINHYKAIAVRIQPA